jgi:TolB protein
VRPADSCRYYQRLSIATLLWLFISFPPFAIAQINSVPDYDRVVYTSRVSGDWEIYSALSDGTDPQRLTNQIGEDTYPVWSPDRLSIAFISDRDGTPEIYIMNSDGSNVRRVTLDEAFASMPSWSPDGASIAYVSERGGSSWIYVVSLLDGTSQPITSGEYEDKYPAWSPDGRKIAFASTRGGNFNLYLMNVVGQEIEQLTYLTSSENTAPAWSPDGQRIAFISQRGRDAEINVLDIRLGTTEVIAFKEDEYMFTPTWSPDGNGIMYTTQTLEGEQSIVFRELNGFGLRVVFTESVYPSWASLSPLVIHSSSNVENTSRPVNTLQGVVATGRLNIRDGAGADYSELSRISFSDPVVIYGRDTIGRWVQIDAPTVGVTGWVNSRFLLVNEDILALPILWDNPGERTPIVQEGTIIYGTIEVDGDLNIRQQATPDSASVGVLNDNDPVTIIGRNGSASWVQIDSDPRGWINSSFIVATNLMTLPVITTDQVNGTTRETSPVRSVAQASSVNERSAAAYQPFENGYMVWTRYSDTIYALYALGDWEAYQDQFVEGDAEIDLSIVAPTGRIQPRRGFGMIWRRNTHVRDRLGWGLVTEVGYTAQYRVVEQTGEIRVTAPQGQTFILYPDGTWQR